MRTIGRKDRPFGLRPPLAGHAEPPAQWECEMKHRHLNHEHYTLAAIDDVISRGRWKDWADMRRVALSYPSLMDDIKLVCQHYIADPYAQRYHFWMHYVEEHSGHENTRKEK